MADNTSASTNSLEHFYHISYHMILFGNLSRFVKIRRRCQIGLTPNSHCLSHRTFIVETWATQQLFPICRIFSC
uniref:Uncharacterized protein n=1 Tax=Hyaloperonospora arabidopsidis (strain Emoy2) TaxID=559515 RepID=M4B522_HYAAE